MLGFSTFLSRKVEPKNLNGEVFERIRDRFRITQPFFSGLGRVFGQLIATENSDFIVKSDRFFPF